MPKTPQLPIVVPEPVVTAVRAQLIDRGMKPASKLAASNEAWRVVKLQMDAAPRRDIWTTSVLGVLVTAFKRQGEDGPEVVVKVMS